MMAGTNEVETLVKNLTHLGEGPHWCETSQCLYYVDIKGQKILRFDPGTGKNHASAKLEGDVSGLISVIIPVAGGEVDAEFVISIENSLYLITWSGQDGEPIQLVKRLCTVDVQYDQNRFNDGKCDDLGRLWIGTMGHEDPAVPCSLPLGQGSLYRVDQHGCVQMAADYHLCNGLCWSGDNKNLFFIDSILNVVEGFDFDLELGRISNKRTVFDMHKSGLHGVLDGMTIDDRDHLWIAVYDGSKILEVDPANGDVCGSIDIPLAQNVTSVTFGGPDYRDLYVTTARTGDPQKLKPLSGSLFRIKNVKSPKDGRSVRGRRGHGYQRGFLTFHEK